MAAALDILIESLDPVTPNGGAAPANDSRSAASGFDAAALRLEVIHLLVLILHVPLDEVSLLGIPCAGITRAMRVLYMTLSAHPCAPFRIKPLLVKQVTIVYAQGYADTASCAAVPLFAKNRLMDGAGQRAGRGCGGCPGGARGRRPRRPGGGAGRPRRRGAAAGGAGAGSGAGAGRRHRMDPRRCAGTRWSVYVQVSKYRF